MELLATYSLSQILMFLIVVASSLLGFLKFCSSMWGYISKFLNAYVNRSKREEAANELLETVKRIEQKVMELEMQVSMLTESDRDDIKSYITEKHHYLVYQQHWVDDYTAQSIEARYKHYVDEGGNSYVGNLMVEIRELPKEPPQ